MSRVKKTTGSGDYEDFLSTNPDTIMFIEPDQNTTLKEHIEILGALIGKNLTVKQIHQLYLEDPDGPSYSKTLKTVYRHLDSLESAGLIKVAGYRKYKGSRQTEKLYCRSAIVYFPAEPPGVNWWETEEGKEHIDRTISAAIEFFQFPESKKAQLAKALVGYYDAWNIIVRRIFEETEKNDGLANIFRDSELGEIKEITRTIGLLGVISEYPEVFEKLRSWFSK
jgi:hypothetical protein